MSNPTTPSSPASDRETWLEHLDRCDQCNYAKSCMGCEIGQGHPHACNCPESGPGNGWELRPIATATNQEDRRQQLRERYQALAEADQARVVIVDPDDLDAIEQALDAVDPFAQVAPPAPRRTELPDAPVAPLDEGFPATDADVDALRVTVALLDTDQADWVKAIVAAAGNLSVRQNPSIRRCHIGQALSTLALAAWHDDDLLHACMVRASCPSLDTASATEAAVLAHVVAELVSERLTFSVNADGDMQLRAASGSAA